MTFTLSLTVAEELTVCDGHSGQEEPTTCTGPRLTVMSSVREPPVVQTDCARGQRVRDGEDRRERRRELGGEVLGLPETLSSSSTFPWWL